MQEMNSGSTNNPAEDRYNPQPIEKQSIVSTITSVYYCVS